VAAAAGGEAVAVVVVEDSRSDNWDTRRVEAAADIAAEAFAEVVVDTTVKVVEGTCLDNNQDSREVADALEEEEAKAASAETASVAAKVVAPNPWVVNPPQRNPWALETGRLLPVHRCCSYFLVGLQAKKWNLMMTA
jgi:hypothetical protein